MRQHRQVFSVAGMCRSLKVSPSGFYGCVTDQGRGKLRAQVELLARVREIHRESSGSYGSRRTARQLQSEGQGVGRYRARTLMRQAGLAVKMKKRFKVTTDSRHEHAVAPNLLHRQFNVGDPNRVWAGDITYLWTREGWLYLAVLMDLYSRKVVGWSLARTISEGLVGDALRMAAGRRGPEDGLMHHSDRGSQYAGHGYQRLLAKHGMICSMARKGDCWDNAVVERFFGSLKRERTSHRRYETRNEARLDVIDYIEMFYNPKRLHSHLGYLSPDEFERRTLFSRVSGST